jgi:hypothetical protein
MTKKDAETILRFIKYHPMRNALDISDNTEIKLWTVYDELELLYKEKKIIKHFTIKGVLYTIKE